MTLAIFFAFLSCKVATTFLAMVYYFISLCTVHFLRIGLNFLSSSLEVVFFLFFSVQYLDVPGNPVFLCSVHSRITCILLPFLAIFFF